MFMMRIPRYCISIINNKLADALHNNTLSEKVFKCGLLSACYNPATETVLEEWRAPALRQRHIDAIYKISSSSTQY